MNITAITAFPKLLKAFFSTGVIAKGINLGCLQAEVLDIRDYASGEYRQIDDYAFGGGGMLLMAEPLRKAVEDAQSRHGKAFVLGTSPQGNVLCQDMVETLAEKEHLVVVCGRYEGMDERFVQNCVDAEISLGDFVLTGGELAAMVIADSVSRRIPGVVGKESAVEEDSFAQGFLDHPHYTRPALWDGLEVPRELLSGNHEEILSWRRQEAVRRTLARRPEVLGRSGIGPYMQGGAYLVLLLGEAGELNRFEDILEKSLNLVEVFQLSRLCCVTPSPSLREKMATSRNGRPLKVFSSFDKCRGWITKREKQKPFILSLQEDAPSGNTPRFRVLEVKRTLLERQLPGVFLLPLGKPEQKHKGDACLFPLLGKLGRGGKLSQGDRLTIVLDRFFGTS